MVKSGRKHFLYLTRSGKYVQNASVKCKRQCNSMEYMAGSSIHLNRKYSIWIISKYLLFQGTIYEEYYNSYVQYNYFQYPINYHQINYKCIFFGSGRYFLTKVHSTRPKWEITSACFDYVCSCKSVYTNAQREKKNKSSASGASYACGN